MNAPSHKNDGMGSLLYADGTARFRLWAPHAAKVELILDHPAPSTIFSLANEPGTPNWSADNIPANSNTRYQYRITTLPGPENAPGPHLRTDARALQVEGSDPSKMGYVIDATLFTKNRAEFTTPSFADFLIYQLHVGSFTGLHDGVQHTPPTSTFVDVGARLKHIRDLGFNAIELLPISDFRADLNTAAGEGYGPCDMYASENLYASAPNAAVKELVQLIDEAHGMGIAVILDVVYNHASTKNNRYWQYDGNCSKNDAQEPGGIYFAGGHNTPWGDGFAVSQSAVLDFLIDNARMYLGSYRVDGLRFDAVQAIAPDAVRSIVHTLRREFPSKYLIAEYNPGDSGSSVASPRDPYGDLGFCATWNLGSPINSDFFEGNSVVSSLLARIGAFADPEPWHHVNYFTGSHDQIFAGNDGRYVIERFEGRLDSKARAKARLLWALNVTVAGIPMLFMGTEGHVDGFWDPVVATNYDHRLNWELVRDGLGTHMQSMVADINRVRRERAALRSPGGQVTHIDEKNKVVAFKRWNNVGDVLLVVVNAGSVQWSNTDYAVSLSGDGGSWQEIFNSQAPRYGGVNTVGNSGNVLSARNGQLSINLSNWSVHVFAKI